MERSNKTQLRNRLSRVEGQIRGIAKMVDEDRYCIDVLTQLQAVRSALAKVESEMLKDHLNTCIVGAMASGDADQQREKAQELIALLERTAR
jgi:CsoR family transcriptional regulator, copper-sensing transcriptional repressor